MLNMENFSDALKQKYTIKSKKSKKKTLKSSLRKKLNKKIKKHNK